MSKRITTIICCVAFVLGGYFMSATSNANLIAQKTNTAMAAEVPQVIMQYPKDLLLGHRNNVGLITVHDTIRDTVPLEIRHDTVTAVRYKTKWRTKLERVPDTCARQAPVDTLYVSRPVIVIPSVKEEAGDTTNLNVQ